MNVNSISGGSYAGQVSAPDANRVRQPPPPPPRGSQPPDAGGFINAIGEALQSLGVTDVAASEKESAASALGSFLQELMASLHEQGSASGAQQEGAFGPAGQGGAGRLAEDLQGLIASLKTDGDGEASALETSFSSLLESLGADSSDSQNKLASFLQTLADKLPQSGSSGNLVNTKA